ncbi:MAG: M20/M25/M40 family metallo-hydrolase [Negativicutes bacterium]|nr:M20/M25/M40 family metallo-hydrolase [Negativicutes bacterium]
MSSYVVKGEIKDVFGQIMGLARVSKGLEFIELDQPQTIEDQKVMVTIEAPTFAEEKRAQHYAGCLKDLGLEEVHIDRHGNVLGTLRGKGDGPKILLEAHLDTVFPFGTNVTPIEKDGKIFAPGICDDTRGLAANLSVIRAFKESGIETEGDIIFCGTVGEEGLGGMWGMKALLEDNTDIAATISIDGAGCDSILFEATGIRNFEVTYTGPGGHSYVAFGTPSPLHAAARAISKLSDMRPPALPMTTFTVSLIEGGHAIHAIAQKAMFTINMRSDDPDELEKLQAQALEIFALGAQEENERWGSTAITMEYKMILDVPAGSQPSDCDIVQASWQATECLGISPVLVPGGCTNTNMPVCMGIPAVTLGRGGKEGGVHSLDEWFDPEGTYRCPQKSFILLLALAGIYGETKPLIEKR